MWAYTLRRLLWMIPTFIGILLINFAVLRIQGLSLADKVSGGPADGERKVEASTGNLDTWVQRFRRTGNDLPALINLRGFVSREGVRQRLIATERHPTVNEAWRQRREIEGLWFQGHLLVQPLADILADDAQAELHGPTSMALSMCAMRPILPEELETMPAAEQSRLRTRNDILRRNRIAYDNTREKGFVTTDPQAAEKRAALLAAVRGEPDYSRTDRWHAVLFETGFTHFLVRLVTFDLYSETRKANVFTVIGQHWAVTAWLNFIAIAVGWLVSIPLGVWSAKKAGTLADQATTGALFALWSVPSFFVATLFLHHLCTDSSTGTALFPNRGLSSPDSLWMSTPGYLGDLLWHAFLPLVCLTYASFTSLSRYMRANVLEQLNSDYVRTARAKGVDERTVLWRHATRNSMVTMITLGAGLLASLFGGFVFVESVFSIPGLGTLLLDAALQQDAPLLMASTVISVLLLLVGILIADLLYAVADPRIKARYG